MPSEPATHADLRGLGYRVFKCEDVEYRGEELGPGDLTRWKHFDVFAVPEELAIVSRPAATAARARYIASARSMLLFADGCLGLSRSVWRNSCAASAH